MANIIEKNGENDKVELRMITCPVSLRAVTDENGKESRTVEGYALIFGQSSDGLWHEEVIERGALDGILEKSDVKAWFNHDRSKGLLARSKKGNGTLSLQVDEKGLRYSFEAPNSAVGDELLENLRRGEVDESSFAFSVQEDNWERQTKGAKYEWKRTIKKFAEIFDVSPVYDGAYSQTTVYTRGREDIIAQDKELDAQIAAEARHKQEIEDENMKWQNIFAF